MADELILIHFFLLLTNAALYGLLQAIQRQVDQRIGAQRLGQLPVVQVVGDQFLSSWNVDAEQSFYKGNEISRLIWLNSMLL